MSSIVEIIDSSEGKIFTVTFVKKDGSIRTMTARLGVKKHLKGGECTLDREQYIIAYDMANNGYRAINRATILSLSFQGTTIYTSEGQQWSL